MDETSKKELARILAINPEDLSYEEIQFLNARRSYLTNDQKRIFASILVKEKKV